MIALAVQADLGAWAAAIVAVSIPVFGFLQFLIPAAISALSGFFSRGGGGDSGSGTENLDPEMRELLLSTMRREAARSQATDPLWGATMGGVYEMLPKFARDNAFQIPNLSSGSADGGGGGGTSSGGPQRSVDVGSGPTGEQPFNGRNPPQGEPRARVLPSRTGDPMRQPVSGRTLPLPSRTGERPRTAMDLQYPDVSDGLTLEDAIAILNAQGLSYPSWTPSR